MRAQRRAVCGQYTIEVSVLLAAIVIAAVLMAPHVRGSLRANVKITEMQLNSAIEDNRP